MTKNIYVLLCICAMYVHTCMYVCMCEWMGKNIVFYEMITLKHVLKIVYNWMEANK